MKALFNLCFYFQEVELFPTNPYKTPKGYPKTILLDEYEKPSHSFKQYRSLISNSSAGHN